MAKNRNSYYDHEFSLFHHVMFLKKRTKIVFFAVQKYSPYMVSSASHHSFIEIKQGNMMAILNSSRLKKTILILK